MSRWSVSGGRSPLHGRITLLCLILLLMGSPWGQGHVEDLYLDNLDNGTTRWLVEGAFVPRWDYTSDAYIDFAAASDMLVVENISAVLLLVALALVMSRSRTGYDPG